MLLVRLSDLPLPSRHPRVNIILPPSRQSPSNPPSAFGKLRQCCPPPHALTRLLINWLSCSAAFPRQCLAFLSPLTAAGVKPLGFVRTGIRGAGGQDRSRARRSAARARPRPPDSYDTTRIFFPSAEERLCKLDERSELRGAPTGGAGEALLALEPELRQRHSVDLKLPDKSTEICSPDFNSSHFNLHAPSLVLLPAEIPILS